MIYVDMRSTINRLRPIHAAMTSRQFNTGISRALNRTATMGRTDVTREVRERYTIRARDVRASINIVRARPVQMTAKVISKGKPLPLIGMDPRQTKRGVSVNILGQRVVINRAFIQTMRSGHRGVFARGSYTKGGKTHFEFRKKRGQAQYGKVFRKIKGNNVPIDKPDLPISELYTLSVPAALAQHNIDKRVEGKMRVNFEKRLVHELNYIASKL